MIWYNNDSAYCHENILEIDWYATSTIKRVGNHRVQWKHASLCTWPRVHDRWIVHWRFSAPHIRLFRVVAGKKFRFMDDKALCHRTQLVQDCLEAEAICHLDCTFSSLETNPTENVRDALGRHITAWQFSPINKKALISVV